jgi:hypothetical protein
MGCANSKPRLMSVATLKTTPAPRALARVFAPISDIKTRPNTAEEAANVAKLKEEFAL